MKSLKCFNRSLLVAVALASSVSALAQSPPAAGEKITGAQLQAWLDGKFSYGGLHKPSQCVLLNAAHGDGRVLFIRCPNGWAEKINGTARVVGDTYCTSFPIPGTPAGEDCVTWHSLGSWRFEQRKGSELDTSVVIFPQFFEAPK